MKKVPDMHIDIIKTQYGKVITYSLPGTLNIRYFEKSKSGLTRWLVWDVESNQKFYSTDLAKGLLKAYSHLRKVSHVQV